MATQFKKVSANLQATETTETSLGDITAPIDARRITGLYAVANLETGTAGDGCLGWARISFTNSGEIDGVPCAIADKIDVGMESLEPEFIPVNIAVPPLAAIHCFMTLSVAQGGQSYGMVCLRFE